MREGEAGSGRRQVCCSLGCRAAVRRSPETAVLVRTAQRGSSRPAPRRKPHAAAHRVHPAVAVLRLLEGALLDGAQRAAHRARAALQRPPVGGLRVARRPDLGLRPGARERARCGGRQHSSTACEQPRHLLPPRLAARHHQARPPHSQPAHGSPRARPARAALAHTRGTARTASRLWDFRIGRGGPPGSVAGATRGARLLLSLHPSAATPLVSEAQRSALLIWPEPGCNRLTFGHHSDAVALLVHRHVAALAEHNLVGRGCRGVGQAGRKRGEVVGCGGAGRRAGGRTAAARAGSY